MTVGLVAAPDFKPRIGGVAEHSHQMMKHLTEIGEKVVVVAPDTRGAVEFDRSCGYSVIRFASGSTSGWRSRMSRALLWRAMLEAAEALKPDYLVCSRWDPITGSISALASRVLRIPLFVFAHGSELSHRLAWTPLQRLTLQEALRVVCVSSYTRSLVEQLGVHPDRLEVIPNGFDLRIIERYRRQRDASRLRRLESVFHGGSPAVLTISRLTERKGVDRVIAAMPAVVSAVPDAVYIIGGDGPDRQRLERLRDSSPARDAIKFLGRVTEDEKLECYDRCSLFAMPNRVQRGDVEGFGIVFLEANAFGKPVIGGRSGGAIDAIIDGETGLLVDPNDVGEIASSIALLLGDVEESKRLGACGKRRVEIDLDWSVCARRFRSVLLNALA